MTGRPSDTRDNLVPALLAATIRVEPQPSYPLRRRIPSRSRPQKAIRIRAHVLTPSNNTIASSMVESLRWCHKKHALRPRNCHHSVAASARTKPFSRADENILKQRAAYLVVKKTGRSTCSSSSISSGISHAADSLPQSMSGRPVNDRALSRYPRPGQPRHLCRPCTGCLPRGLGSQRRPHQDQISPRAPGRCLSGVRQTQAGLLPLSLLPGSNREKRKILVSAPNDRPPPGGLLSRREPVQSPLRWKTLWKDVLIS
jgi:hypothetical protein